MKSRRHFATQIVHSGTGIVFDSRIKLSLLLVVKILKQLLGCRTVYK